MKNIITIVKKELKRFFCDKRMLMSLFLPGILIFVVYSLMGSFMGDLTNGDKNHEYIVKTFNKPEDLDLSNLYSMFNVNVSSVNENEIEEIKTKISNKEVDLLIYYPTNFEKDVEGKNNMSLYYLSTSKNSSFIYNLTFEFLNTSSVNPTTSSFYVNKLDEKYDLASEEDSTKMIISMMIPFFLLTFLVTGCLSTSTESIAGEKERGTISTLLITPIKRSELALGKIISLAITSICSALASFLGVVLSMPKLFNGMDFSMSMYKPLDFVALFLIILVLVLLFVVLLSIVSTFAKSVKEATQYGTPILVLVMMIGLSSLITMGQVQTNSIFYLIPIYNALQCMGEIFSLTLNPMHLFLTIITNVIGIVVGVYILTKMFNSERIMYNK